MILLKKNKLKNEKKAEKNVALIVKKQKKYMNFIREEMTQHLVHIV